MMVMMTLFMTLAMMTGSGLGSTCLRNEDCASACCSGYGWCVGSQSGDIQDIFRNWSCKVIFLRMDLLWTTAQSLCVRLMWPGDNDNDHVTHDTHVRTLTAPPQWPGPDAAPPGAGVLTTALSRVEGKSRNLSPVFQKYASRNQSGDQPVLNRNITTNYKYKYCLNLKSSSLETRRYVGMTNLKRWKYWLFKIFYFCKYLK